jgi:peptidoglycan L-alanyl-D-glutamate endopeptidase CwlK
MKARKRDWSGFGTVAAFVTVLGLTFWVGFRMGRRLTDTPPEGHAPTTVSQHLPESSTGIKKPAVTPTTPAARPKGVIDSNISPKDALGENHFPADFLAQMVVLKVRYFGFDERLHLGQIVVNRDVAEDVQEIFAELLEQRWPIEKVRPIVAYGWQDQASINDNNTSGFNYRRTIGPGMGNEVSMHAYGRAIDLNPYVNPFLDARGHGSRPYDTGAKGAITHNSPPYIAFIKRGWTWGGDWPGGKDYQHFEKGKRTL